MNLEEIELALPHRYPFLMVDKIILLDIETNRIVGQKNLSINEQIFQGHFPGNPVMPGVLILESIAQTGGIFAHKVGYTDTAFLMSVSDAKFREPAIPGDVLYIDVKVLISSKGIKLEGVVTLQGKDSPIAEALLRLAFVKT